MTGRIKNPWKTNVLGVLGECSYCVPSILCPSFAYYSTSELFEVPPAGVVESCFGGYCCCFGFLIRTKLRNRYNLDGSFVGDFLVHLCCHCVALARIWREAEMQRQAEEEVGKMVIRPQQPAAHLQPPHIHQPLSGDHSFIPVPGGGGGIAPVYYPSPNPQPSFQPAARTDPHRRANTVDDSLSGFDNERETVVEGSYQRENSLDPPPSNTDPNPWDMMHRNREREEPSPMVLPFPPPIREETHENYISPGNQGSRRCITRESYLEFLTGTLPGNPHSGPTENPSGMSEEPESSSKPYASDSTRNNGIDLHSRLATLRPPNTQTTSPDRSDKDADRIILEDDSAEQLGVVEEELLEDIASQRLLSRPINSHQTLPNEASTSTALEGRKP